MRSLMVVVAFVVCSVEGLAQGKTLLHNPNKYPVWVATGVYGNGGEQFVGGPVDPPTAAFGIVGRRTDLRCGCGRSRTGWPPIRRERCSRRPISSNPSVLRSRWSIGPSR
jgi:hypothetical protein